MIQEPVYDEIIIVNNEDKIISLEVFLRYGFTYMYVMAISGRVLVREGDRWGMLRGHGQAVLPVVYDSIDIVWYHWADSNVYIISKDGLYGVVDAMGKCYIPMEYPPLYDE